jgi:hypothetical protein
MALANIWPAAQASALPFIDKSSTLRHFGTAAAGKMNHSHSQVQDDRTHLVHQYQRRYQL